MTFAGRKLPSAREHHGNEDSLVLGTGWHARCGPGSPIHPVGRGRPPGLGAAPQVSAAAFTLQGTAASAPLGTTRGPVFIAVSERKDPYVPMLDEVKERVREDLIKTKATEASKERATAVAAALKSAKDFAAAAKAQGLEAKDTELVPCGAASLRLRRDAWESKVRVRPRERVS